MLWIRLKASFVFDTNTASKLSFCQELSNLFLLEVLMQYRAQSRLKFVHWRIDDFDSSPKSHLLLPLPLPSSCTAAVQCTHPHHPCLQNLLQVFWLASCCSDALKLLSGEAATSCRTRRARTFSYCVYIYAVYVSARSAALSRVLFLCGCQLETGNFGSSKVRGNEQHLSYLA